MTVNRTLALRLYPSKRQKRAFETNLECCRTVYNQSLEDFIRYYEETKESMSFFDLNNNLTEMLNERTELKEAYRQCLTESVLRLHKAFQAFFKRLKKGETPGFPRFKGKDRIRSFTYTHRSQYSLLNDKKRLKLGKIGDIHFKGSIPSYFEWGTPKTCTIKRSSTGKWFAFIAYEFDYLQSGCELFREKTDVGVDLNIRNLATLSDGTVYPNHRLIEKSQEQIAKIQRKMSKHEKGSVMREKYKRHLNHAFERLNNRRDDEAHRISRELVDNHTLLAFEDLDIQKMIDKVEEKCECKQQEHNIHRAFYSVAWDRLLKYTEYKAEEAGIPMIKVDPAYTSQMCSECGTIIPKTLDDRMHTCSVCGLSIPRDRNAAINILKRARGADLHCASNENHSPKGGSDLRHTSESCKTGVSTHWFNIAKE